MTEQPNESALVLVVEDYQDAREMYAAYLQFSGYRVAEATNGLEAIEKALELMPDIILMDLALPKVDGRQEGQRGRVRCRRRGWSRRLQRRWSAG